MEPKLWPPTLSFLNVGGRRQNEAYYHHDTVNQLVHEDNMCFGKTFVWTYDDAGNITSKYSCSYVPPADEPWLEYAFPESSYTYGDSAWGDLLTAYNGVQWSYDQIGNLTNDGTWSYTWQNGRELASMTKGTTTWNYTYDANGMRTSRSNGTKTYNYVYNGSQLMAMTNRGNTIPCATGATSMTQRISSSTASEYRPFLS